MLTFLSRLRRLIYRVIDAIERWVHLLRDFWLSWAFKGKGIKKINICCGAQKIHDYTGLDLSHSADIRIDLSKSKLPFANETLDAVICISGINYFTRARGREIISETFRTLKVGGIARFAVQDLESIAKKYVSNDQQFYFQKLSDGQDRFEGPTIGDKFVAWFYGYASSGLPCQYFYDFESLAYIFKDVGFSVVERKGYRQSRLSDIESIDNRPDQMFFLEAVK